MKSVSFSSQSKSLFILSFPKPNLFSGKGVHLHEDKQTRNMVRFDPANFEMSEICVANVQSNVTWHSYFLILWQSFCGRRAKSLKNFFLNPWKCNLFDFVERSGDRCANTNTNTNTNIH